MFPLIAVEQYARRNSVLSEDIIRYFHTKKYVQQKGRFFFLNDNKSENNTADISLKPLTELENQAQEWLKLGSYSSLDSALDAAKLCYLIDLNDSLRESFKKARYFFDISSRYVLDKNRSLLDESFYGKKNARHNVREFIDKKTPLGKKTENQIVKNNESGSLDELIYAQFDFALKSAAPWKKCEHCGKVFKFYKETNLFTGKSIRNSAYCKRSCSTMAGSKKNK